MPGVRGRRTGPRFAIAVANQTKIRFNAKGSLAGFH
jgi:hypothetical protein